MNELNLAAYSWVGFAVGGVIGALLLMTVFEWALVILSSLAGAALVSDGAGRPEHSLQMYLVALVVGLVVQGVQLQVKREPAKVEPRR